MASVEIYNFNTNAWTSYNGEESGRVIKQTVDDSLDTGTVLIETTSSSPFRQLTPTRFYLTDTDYVDMLIANDSVTLYGKGELITWNHTLTLVEPTKILEKILSNTLKLTNLNDTLLEQFQKAVNNIVLRYNDANLDKVNFVIDSSINSAFGNLPSEDFEFGANTTARDIFDELLSVVNSRVRAVVTPPSMTITLFAVSLTAQQETALNYDIVSEEYDNDVDSYALSIKANVSNGRVRNVIVQNKSGLKTKELILDTNNASILFDYPIEEIEQVNFYIDKEVRYLVEGDPVYKNFTFNYSIPIDVTDNFLDKEAYDLLGSTEKPNYWFYERGQTTVDIRRADIPFWGNLGFDNLPQILIVKLFEYIKANIAPTATNAEFTSIVTANNLITSMLVDVVYYPTINTTLTAIKPSNYNAFNAELGIVNNQGNGTVDIMRLGSNLLGQIIKVGNDEYYLDSDYDGQESYNSIIPLLSRIGSYVVFARDISVTDTADTTFYKVRYYLSENFNNISERVNIDREKRIYAIPLTSAETELVDKNYVYVGTTAPSVDFAVKKMLTSKALSAFANTLRGIPKYKSGASELDFLAVDRMISSTYITPAIIIPTHELSIAKYGAGNSINFKGKYYDNFSAGISIGGQVIGGKQAVYNSYTNGIGEVDSFEFYLVNGQSGTAMTYNNYKALPLTDNNFYSLQDKISQNTRAYYLKDRSQQIAIIQSFYIMAAALDKNNIVVGNKFAENNNLINPENRTLRIKVSTTKYNQDERMFAKGTQLSGTASSLLSITSLADYCKISYNGAIVANTHSAWAICDSNNNLYLAVNANINTIKDLYIYSDKLLH